MTHKAGGSSRYPDERQYNNHRSLSTASTPPAHLRLWREVGVLGDGLVHAALGGGHGAGGGHIQTATCAEGQAGKSGQIIEHRRVVGRAGRTAGAPTWVWVNRMSESAESSAGAAHPGGGW